MNACTPLLSQSLLLSPTAPEATTHAPAAEAGASGRCQFGLAMLDAGLRFTETSVGLQRLLGRGADALAGRELFAFASNASDAIMDGINDVLRLTNQWNGLMEVVQPGGVAVVLEWHVEGQAGSDRRMAFALDVSARRQVDDEVERLLQRERAARAESERINRLKDDFVAIAVHELRHPLAPMRNAVYLLQHHRDGTSAAQKARDILDRQLRQMTVLIDDLMDISRADRDAIKLDRQWISLDSAVDAAVETSQPHMVAADQVLHVGYGAHLSVCVDRVRFGQVLVNILNNASKYTPRGGRIDVVVSRREDWAEVAIVDNGAGIPPERIAEVFEPFTKLHPTHARAADGLGIGLALARRFMELHGGSISACSDGEGKGSRFVVRLPLEAQ